MDDNIRYVWPSQPSLHKRPLMFPNPTACPEVGNLNDTLSPVTQACDIWSLGAVLSLVATFIVLGPQGIIQYACVRTEAAKRRTGFKADIFHDGTRVLPEVGKWHEYLRGQRRIADGWTGEILDFIEMHMLVVPAEDRLSAKEVFEGLRHLLGEPGSVSM